jgi:hypothetical protein
MLLHVIFWIMAAIDAAVLGFVLLLGMAAAKPSHTSPMAVIAFLAAPALILLACIAVFLKAQGTGWRIAALILAASPVLLAVGGFLRSEQELRGYKNGDGSWNTFKSEQLRQVERAIANHDTAVLASAAKQVNLNEAGRAGATPLLLAIRQLEKTPSQIGLMQMLLEAGADPNGVKGSDPPLAAAIRISRRTGLEPVRLLLKAGADPNRRNEYGTPAYFSAAGVTVNVEVLQVLLDSGADLNATDRTGCGALFHAVNTRNWKAVLLMLERGADWRKVRTPDGLGLRERLESEVRLVGNGQGLAEVMRFVQADRGR